MHLFLLFWVSSSKEIDLNEVGGFQGAGEGVVVLAIVLPCFGPQHYF